LFSFFKKSKAAETIISRLPISLDIHSHILPGIDDGAPDMETSIRLIRGLYDLGIRRSVATPHIIGDLYRNTPETIGNALEKTKAACSAAGIGMELSAAAEYMLDDHFMCIIRDQQPLLTISGNFVLTEFPYSLPPVNEEEMVFGIITSGYRPILAHPERYAYFHENYKVYHKLKEMGFHLQVNLLSLTGYYGNAVAKAARYILVKDLAVLVGTDLHHARHLGALQDNRSLALLDKLLKGKSLNPF